MGFPRYPKRTGRCSRHYWIGYGGLRNEDCPKCKALKQKDMFALRLKIWFEPLSIVSSGSDA